MNWNNRAIQTSNSSYIQLGDWYIGIHMEDNGELSIHVDNDNGMVMEREDANIADDIQQYAVRLYTHRHRIWTKSGMRRKMVVETKGQTDGN